MENLPDCETCLHNLEIRKNYGLKDDCSVCGLNGKYQYIPDLNLVDCPECEKLCEQIEDFDELKRKLLSLLYSNNEAEDVIQGCIKLLNEKIQLVFWQGLLYNSSMLIITFSLWMVLLSGIFMRECRSVLNKM